MIPKCLETFGKIPFLVVGRDDDRNVRLDSLHIFVGIIAFFLRGIMTFMRIAHFSDTFFPKVDGVAVSLATLACELGRRGHPVAIFCPAPARGKRITWSAENVAIFTVASVPTFYPDFRLGAPTPRSLMELQDFRADVVHLHSPGPLGMEALVGARRLRAPVVGTFHAYFMEPEYLRLVRLSRFKHVSKALWRYVMAFYNVCDFVVAPTRFVAHDLRKHGLKKPFKEVPNGVDFSLIRGVQEMAIQRIKKALGLKNHVILYVGRLSREKNLEIMMRAFAEINEEITQAQLLLVGDGPQRQELSGLAEQLGIVKRVIFTGEIVHDRLLSSGIFQASSVFCTPSTSETQGLSVVEAIAAGLPIVGVAARGVKELIRGNGILIDREDAGELSKAICYFLSNEKHRKRAAKRSKELAECYSIDKVTNTMEKVYTSLIS